MKINLYSPRIQFVLLLALAGLIFFIDLQTPRGIADGILYISVVIAALWIKNVWSSVLAGILVTALIITGYLLSPVSISDHELSGINRLFSLATVWLAVLLTHRHKTMQRRSLNFKDQANARLKEYAEQLEESKIMLESRVRDKTEDLHKSLQRLASVNARYEQEYAQAQKLLCTLRERENQLSAITDNYPNGLLSIINRDRRYVMASGQDVGLSEKSASSLIGSLYIPLRYRENREFVEGLLAKGFEGEKITFAYDDPYSGRAYQVCGVPLQGSGPRVDQLLIASHDVTIMKKAEHDIRYALEKEKELNEVKTRFVTTASHEFRTPLGAILSSASLIGMYNGIDDAQKREKHVRRISASVAHLTEILDNFLSISRIESGRTKGKKDSVKLNDLVDEVVEELSVSRAPGQVIIIEAPIDPITFTTDRYMLRAILTNLLSNALKYSHPGNEVLLGFQKQQETLLLRVKDHGIGIPRLQQEQVFQSFFRASNAEHIEGIGLGLHIVKKYVELLGGSIAFESLPEKHTVFEVKLNVDSPLESTTC